MNIQFDFETYVEYVEKLNDVLEKLKKLESEYIIEYQKYKEKKHKVEQEALNMKEKKELKTLKDVEAFVNDIMLEDKAKLTKLEANITWFKYEKQKLQNIVELIKMKLILDKRIEKEILNSNGLE